MHSESNERQKLEKILVNFLEAIQNQIAGSDPKIYEKIIIEKEKLNFLNLKIFPPYQSPTCRFLKKALNKIPSSLTPIDTLTKSIANKLIWHEAERGVPKYFKGGYAFAEIIGEMGLKFSDKIRIGFFLQKPNTNYPLHAHDAEELYFILSGSAHWQIGEKKFKVNPGLTIQHAARESHAMVTSKLPLFALWIWTGKINGQYWFTSEKNGHKKI